MFERSRPNPRAMDHVLPATPAPVAPYGFDFTTNELRIDADLICPRCLGWIGRDEIVRRTAFGPTQHEVCPHPVGGR